MRLKRLEICGFKTFRDKVVFEFLPGISGVIGPNGCGKSNVVDALRWAMGEQRVKAIRGKKMDDVIFNGSESASAVGMAEVIMTMVSDGQPFAGAYCECSEVTIGRRLFRDGDSEYYINKVPCRLLDVKEFFMDTGIGARTYSLVEQNSVSTLVEAKPEERRQFIEEAAGIAKYKSRKDAALRKMEATEQNMVRLHDIIKEVKSQLNAVSRQAKRAEQYKNIKKEIKETEISIAVTSYCDLMKKRAELEKTKSALDNRREEIVTDLKSREAAYEEMKLTVLENEEIISRCREELYSTRNSINMKEQSIEFSRGKIADLTLKKERDILEIDERKRKLADTVNEISFLAESTGITEKDIGDVKDRLTAHQQQLDMLRKTEKNFSDGLERKKASYIDVVAEKARLRNAEMNILKTIEDMKRRQERHLKELEEYNARSEVLHDKLQDLRAGLHEDEKSLDELKGRHNELLQELNDTRRQLKEIDAAIISIRDENGRTSARLSSLEQFHEGYTWCSEGTKSIMTAKSWEGMNELSGDMFLGLVADHIDVPEEYETAVEAVLGERLQYVVVRSQEDGVRAIDYLKQSATGRGTFVPLEVRNHARNQPLADHLQGATVRLFDKVGVPDNFREIVSYLLGDVLLISSLRSGLSLWRQNGFRGTFVTHEGDIINSQGVMTGGSKSKGERSLLAIKREIGELKKESIRLSGALRKAEEKKEALSHGVIQYEEELQQNKTDTHRLEIEINGKRKDLERFDDELKRIEQRQSILKFDNETIAAEQQEDVERLEKIKEEHLACEEQERVINDEIETVKEKIDELGKELYAVEEGLTTAKVLLATYEEKRESDRKTRLRLETMKDTLQREIKERSDETENSAMNASEMAKNIDRDNEILTSLQERYQVLETSLSEKVEGQQEREALQRKWEKEVKDIKLNVEQVVKEIGDREVSLRETAFQIETLQKVIKEKHYLDLDVLSQEYPALQSDELEKAAIKLEKTRATLESFGEVNLLAINEFEELKERYDFLSAQEADISASLESLQRTIERINRISRARFAETFEAVNASFQSMFSRIFPGGKGQLYLTDTNDMLETGVEIDIQIPGKRTRNVSLLSGGEKSLAAIALIFAILEYRPAPFLVLDEVDAALDDANISLFNKLIKDISLHSQILMITHNKKTMEVAENLFGVTMQNQGISTLVSVNLN